MACNRRKNTVLTGFLKEADELEPVCNETEAKLTTHKKALLVFVACLLIFYVITVEIRLCRLQTENELIKTQIETIHADLSNLDLDIDHLYSGFEDEDDNRTDIYELEFEYKAKQSEDTDISLKQRLKRNVNNAEDKTHRNKENRGKDRSLRRNMRRIEAVHFEVDSALYSLKIEHAGAVLNVWTQRDGDSTFGQFQDNGMFAVSKKGLYLIYSQLTYYDNSGRWCHTIKRNHNIIAKCLASEWGMAVEDGSDRYVRTVHNCYTSLVTFLRPGDHLSISSLYGSRTIHSGKDMSFWGVVKLA